MLQTYLNRVVAVLVFLTGLAGAVAIPLLDADLTTTAGIIAAVVATAATANRFLIGWQLHEQRVASPGYADAELGAAIPDVTSPPKLVVFPDPEDQELL